MTDKPKPWTAEGADAARIAYGGPRWQNWADLYARGYLKGAKDARAVMLEELEQDKEEHD